MFPIIIAILIFLIVAGATWWFGFWSNLITLVNLLLAASIASSIYHPVSNLFVTTQPSFRYLSDFISIWMCFAISMIILRGITDTLSSYRLKFNLAVEMTGRSILSLWIAVVFCCFAMFTLQLAPLPPEFYGESFGPASATGNVCDKAWLSYIQSRSRGALSASQSSNLLFSEYELDEHPDDKDLDCRVFDPQATFLNTAEGNRFGISLNRTLRIGPASSED